MGKRKNFREFREHDEWEKDIHERKRYDKKKQKVRNARKQKRKMKNSYLDSRD